jgi:hypothetical protein
MSKTARLSFVLGSVAWPMGCMMRQLAVEPIAVSFPLFGIGHRKSAGGLPEK